MSLNGLDAPAVVGAASFIKTEPAGWFLLKYATRDEIELYGAGKGGAPEAATQIAAYEEKSPLYGIVTHSAKRALVRYVPAGTSRLLQARVKVHLDAVSSQFAHDGELHITQPDELTNDAIVAASPVVSAAPLSPALSQPASPLNISLEGLPSKTASSSAHGSSSNGDTAVKEDDGSDTPSTRAAKLLADVRAGKLESHEVLAALKITPTRDSDRRPSEHSLEKPMSASSFHAQELNRTASMSSLDPQLAQFPSPRGSVSSTVDPFKAKVKVGPRPSQSPEPNAVTNVASLPAGVTMPKSTPSVSSAHSNSAQITSSPTSSQAGNVPMKIGDSVQNPIVQSPTSVSSMQQSGRAASTAASVMTLPHSLNQRKASSGSLQNRDQQGEEKLRLMRALDLQRKKQARHKAGDEIDSAESSPPLSSSVNSPLSNGFGSSGQSNVHSAIDTATEDEREHASSRPALAQVDTEVPSSRHAATKSSPTLGSMINYPLRGYPPVPPLPSTAQQASTRNPPQARPEEEMPSDLPVSPPPEVESTTRLPDLTASGPATVQIGSNNDTPSNSAANAGTPSGASETGVAAGSMSDSIANGGTNISPATASASKLGKGKVPAPINTSSGIEVGSDDNQRTPVARDASGEKTPPADASNTRSESRQDLSRFHSAHVSISTSISGTSSFLEELESLNVQEAQPMTMMKSPVTPTFPKAPNFPKAPAFSAGESKLRAVENSPTVEEFDAGLKAPTVQAPTSILAESTVNETKVDTAIVKGLPEDPKQEAAPASDPHTAPSEGVAEAAVEPIKEANITPEKQTAVTENTTFAKSDESAAASQDDTREVRPQVAEGAVPAEAPRPSGREKTEKVSEIAEAEAELEPVVEETTPAPTQSRSLPPPGNSVVDPMRAIIEAEMGITPVPTTEVAKPQPTAQTLQSEIPADAKSSPTGAVRSLEQEKTTSPESLETPPDENVDPLAIPKGGSAASLRKHPTVQPPHIWGGALRSASGSSTEPSRHLSPVPDLSRMTRSPSVASNHSGMLRPDSPSGVKKVGVGSRIADRIKALEKSSGGPSSATSPVYAPAAVNVSSRKSSFNTPPGSSGTDARKISTSSSSGGNIFARRFGTVHGAPGSDAGRSDRTSRPGSSASPESTRDQVSKAPSPLDVQASRPAFLRGQSSDSQSQTVSSSRDGAASVASQHKSKSSFSSWTGRRDSVDTPRTGHSRHSSVESIGTNSDKKKENKAKKLMKRVSGAFSPRKERANPAIGDPIAEGAEPEPPSSGYSNRSTTREDSSGGVVSKGSSRPVTRSVNIVVGEVNIQFPDTLLWKRRHVELDGEGFVVLAASNLDKNSRVAPKKYHISEFRRPYIPDQEREELPYSIIMDFKDSSTLQCACQNGVDQSNVLSALVQFHSSYSNA